MYDYYVWVKQIKKKKPIYENKNLENKNFLLIKKTIYEQGLAKYF